MDDKLEKMGEKYASEYDNGEDLTNIDLVRFFAYGAQWQLANMWTLTIEGLPEDGIGCPKSGQRIPCLIYSGGQVVQSDRIYEDVGDEEIEYAWVWEDGITPVMWMPIPEFKKGE